MVNEQINELLQFFEDRLIKNGMKLYRLVLFGSAFTGYMHESSDVDIAIVSVDFVDADINKRAELTYKAEWETISKFDIPLDVIKLTVDEYENETRMIASYIKEGKVVYSAE